MSKKNSGRRTSKRKRIARMKKNQRVGKSQTLGLEPLEERRVLATNPILQGITVDDGSLLDDIELVAPREVTLRFDADQIISANSLGGVVLTYGGEDRALDTNDDIVVAPGHIGIGDQPNQVVVRFADTLPDGMYRIDVLGNGTSPLRNTDGDVYDNDPFTDGAQNFSTVFRLDRGAQIVSVVPQPFARNSDGSLGQQQLNTIDVYFNNDELAAESAENIDFYQLRFTGHSNQFDSNFNTATNTDDVVYKPSSVAYDSAANKATLTFAADIHLLGSGAGTYRLQVGIAPAQEIAAPPREENPTVDPGDQFSTAIYLGTADAAGVIVSSEIDPTVAPLNFVGANDEPGHRDISAENHFGNLINPEDEFPGTTTIYYNFRSDYGFDPDGNALQNLITENQKQRTRDILEIYSYYGGMEFVETVDRGFTVVTGDLRALDPTVPTGPGGVLGIATVDAFIDGMAIMDAAENWSDEFAAEDGANSFSWFETAMHEIGHVLGIGHTYDLPENTILGSDPTQSVGNAEPIFPGPHDIVHLQHIHRPESMDIDLYKFRVESAGMVTIETFAERLPDSSLLDTQLTVFRETGTGRERIASNDDYFSEDSFLELDLTPGIYYVGVSSTGNDAYNPTIPDSGANGTSDGLYELRIHHRPELSSTEQIQDAIVSLHPDSRYRPTTSQAFDGDNDGVAGGAHNFWFRAVSPSDTIVVDKAGNGDFTQIDQAIAAATSGQIVRVVGNVGADGDLSTPGDAAPYLIGRDVFGDVLEDGTRVDIPKGVTLMVDEGVVIKSSASSIVVGSTAPGIDHSGSALQILGTPVANVQLGSFQDDSLGGDSNGLATQPRSGDWGGILFAGELDQGDSRFNYEQQSIFINQINNATIQHAGGFVDIDSLTQVVAPVEMRDMRPTISFNTISNSADAGIAATPDSFAETNFHEPEDQTTLFTSDYTRLGPDIYGNTLQGNSFNALFVRTLTPAGSELLPLTVAGRWNDTDITHVVAENLEIQGTSGNAIINEVTDELIARRDASLRIDPGTVVKLDSSRIEVGLGAQLIAEGRVGQEIIFTSAFDDTYGGSGSFDATSDGFLDEGSRPEAGDWGGLFFDFVSTGSIDNALLTYGGGVIPVEGSFAGFNVLEVHQAEFRLTNSRLVNNAGGTGGQAPLSRFGRTSNDSAAIFVRASQPVIVNNVIENTIADESQRLASAINIDPSSLSFERVADWGRSTGRGDYIVSVDNQGALIRGNQIGGNDLNGMEVRANTLLTESVWDDTDITHLVFGEISIPNYHTNGGLRLESSPTQSLVVKLAGANAGFTASGRQLDIDDRIGGSLQIVGHPNFPVVLTSVFDNTVGAGLTPDFEASTDVLSNGFDDTEPFAGAWRSVRIAEFSNDRNVDTVIEFEPIDIDFNDSDNPRSNGTTENAQVLGLLAANEKSGDDNLRLGFDVHGVIAKTDDSDIYSFQGIGGTEVWIDIDRSTSSLDTVVELITADGFVLASSDSSLTETDSGSGPFNHSDSSRPDVLAQELQKTTYYNSDHFSTNPRDPGMRFFLPNSGQNTYHIRVRGNGTTVGAYEMQVRLSEVDEIPGTTIRQADIRYATNGIEMFGQPGHSPLLGEVGERFDPEDPLPGTNDTFATAQPVGNVLASDRGAISIAGELIDENDVDWYQFDVEYEAVRSDGYASVTFDLDYGDGASRANTSIAVYTGDGRLVAYGDQSNIADDVSAPSEGADIDDLSRGSLGVGDGYIGPILLPATISETGDTRTTYYVAVFSNAHIPREFDNEYLGNCGVVVAGLDDPFEDPCYEGVYPDYNQVIEEVIRFQPVDAVQNIAEDRADGFGPLLGDSEAFLLQDLTFYITRDEVGLQTTLNTADPFTGIAEYYIGSFDGLIGDFDMRPDGRLFGFGLGTDDLVNGPTDENSGIPFEIHPTTGQLVTEEQIPDPEWIVEEAPFATQQLDEMADPPELTEYDCGVQILATAFGEVGDQIFGAGEFGCPAETGVPAAEDSMNLLYGFDYFTLAPNGDPRPEPGDPPVPEDAGSDIMEIGIIDTVTSGAGANTLRVTEATTPGPVFEIPDGLTFTAAGQTFEMNAGPEAVLDYAFGTIRDSDAITFTVDDINYEFDTGPVFVVRDSGRDGETFTVNTTTFELDNDGEFDANNTIIDIEPVTSTAQLRDRMLTAITSIGVTSSFIESPPGSEVYRISMVGDTIAGVSEGGTAIGIDGDYGVSEDAADGTVAIRVEETFSQAQIGAAIVNHFNNNVAGVELGFDSNRMNWQGAITADFSGVPFLLGQASDGNVAAGNTEVPFLAQDTAEDIAATISGLLAGSTFANDVVTFDGGFDAADDPFVIGGEAPGGRITGMAFVGGMLYGVSDTGGLFSINPADASTTYVDSGANLVGFEFSGLTLGPQEIEDGRYAETLFGITATGDIHAFDLNGVPQEVFADGATMVSSGLAGANGIAFSPMQANAWHPVEDVDRRGEDPGHGIHTPISEIGALGFPDPSTPLDDNEADGGPSYYFGQETCLVQEGRNLRPQECFETSFNGVEGAAFGSTGTLISAPFDLSDHDPQDEPYFYFNYWLHTDGTNSGETMADSFQVSILDDSGAVSLLATNNSFRGPLINAIPDDEFDLAPTNGDNYGRVQELFDYHVVTDDDGNIIPPPVEWRQARIPLRDFVGNEELRLVFGFDTAGGFVFGGQTNLEDPIGNPLEMPDRRPTGLIANRGEGVYIDDLVIGFAERGEMVTSHSEDVLRPMDSLIVPNISVPASQIETGTYQLEIRRSFEYAAKAVIDTNDRLAESTSILVPAAADLSPGDHFILSDGVETYTFEFLEGGQLPSIPDAIPIEFQPGARQDRVALATAEAISTLGTAADLDITATTFRGDSGWVGLHGEVVILVDQGALLSFTRYDEVGDVNRNREQGQIIIAQNTIRDSAEYGIRSEPGRRVATDGNNSHIGSVVNFPEPNLAGLAPGATLVNNIVVRSGIGGIRIAGDVGVTDVDGNPVNVGRAATPSARIINNTIVGSNSGDAAGIGIEIANNVSPTLLNNLINSVALGVSIDPTSNSTVVGGSLYHNVTTIGREGDFAIIVPPEETTFFDRARDIYFPANGSQAIDSSVDSLDDRVEFITVRGPLGLSASPILAPSRDASGQLRVDDPDVDGSSGQGAEVFVDRGALDRSDFLGPTASLISPRDNDSAGMDIDPREHSATIIDDDNNPVTEFIVQLVDGGGADSSLGGFGVDDESVLSEFVLLYREDVLLTEGLEYSLSYDLTNNQIRLIPASGVWSLAEYRVELLGGEVITDDNPTAQKIRDLFGNPLLPNVIDENGVGRTIFNVNITQPAFDFGDAPAPYPSTEILGGARHVVDGRLFLGQTVDAEADAVADDGDDGITFDSTLLAGNLATITAISSAVGKLDGWIDFNLDGDWNDPGENVFSAIDVVAGNNTISFNIPVDALTGTTFSRFRLSEAGGLEAGGVTSGGEVEDYEVTIAAPGIDYGNAPAPYPTTSAQNGARHQVVPGFTLGSSISGETDADFNDDNDGVNFEVLVAGRSSTMTVVASQDGFVDAWIDYNEDGDWDDTGEQVYAGSVTEGSNLIDITVPTGIADSSTYARIRYSSTGGLSPVGPATDGEVEDYHVILQDAPLDYGDAAAPFPTLREDDGARHTVVPGIFLGSGVDDELDGQPGTGDGSDEDGVTFGAMLIGGQGSIRVTASTQGRLDAWFDFNGDGDWNDDNEYAITRRVNPGQNPISINVPADAVESTIQTRFRFSTDNSSSTPTGRANNGEVEDYTVNLVTGSGWHNFNLPADVNNDGTVAPGDALLVINELNEPMVSDPETGELGTAPAEPFAFIDVNNDGFVSPIDALIVINNLGNSAPAAALSSVFGVDSPQQSQESLANSVGETNLIWQDEDSDTEDRLNANRAVLQMYGDDEENEPRARRTEAGYEDSVDAIFGDYSV